MTLRPRNDNVIVQRDRVDGEKKTPGGILMPQASRKKPFVGTVLAVGPGKLLDNGKRSGCEDIKEGMRVTFGRFAGNEIDPDDDTLLSMKESEITAAVEK